MTNVESMDNTHSHPLLRWVQVVDFLCRYSVTCALSPTGLMPWFSKIEGNTYATLLHHPFLFKGKTNACSRGSSEPLCDEVGA